MTSKAIVTRVERITPEMAGEWLTANYEKNRQLRWPWIEQLKARMTAGNWRTTHQGLAFAPDGKLLDGQHRLWAIVESGMTIEMMVSRNVPYEAFGVLDQHRIRSVADLASDRWVTPRVVASARAMSRGPVQSGIGHFDDRDPTLLLRFIDEQRETIERVWALMPTDQKARGRRNLTAVVTGALLRASRTVPLKSLHRFIEILVTGQTSGEHENAALLLRDWLMSTGTKDRSTEYQKAQRAIVAFVDNDPIKALYAQPDDLFPLNGNGATRRPLRAEPARHRKKGTNQRRARPGGAG